MAVVAGCLLVLSGCAIRGSSRPQFEEKIYAFADAPGIVYLTSFGSKHDLKPPSAFRRWIIGKDAFDEDQTVVKPYGVAATKGRIYINDGLGSAGYWVLTLATKELRLVQDKLLAGSAGMAIDERGRKYFAVPLLADAKAKGTMGTTKEEGRVVVYDRDDQVLRWGDVPGRPVDVAVAGTRLYVTDIVNHRVLVLDRETLKVLSHFGSRGVGPGEFDFPKAIATDRDGHVFVGDMMNGRIKEFDGEGRFLAQYGYRAPLLGSFISLSGLAVDREGRIYAVDSSAQQKVKKDEVQVFEVSKFYGAGEKVPPIETRLEERKNALYGYFQKPNAIENPEYSLYRPIGVAIDYDNAPYFQSLLKPGLKIEYLIWLTSQGAANGRNVSVFAYTVSK